MLGKALAATLLGLPLTTGVIGLIILLWPGQLAVNALPWLLMAFPLWIGTMSLAFWFRSARHAWLWLGGATALSFALIHIARVLGWAAELPK